MHNKSVRSKIDIHLNFLCNHFFFFQGAAAKLEEKSTEKYKILQNDKVGRYNVPLRRRSDTRFFFKNFIYFCENIAKPYRSPLLKRIKVKI